MAEINQSELSKILNISRSGVNVAIKRGKIVKNSAGLIDTQNKQNSDWLISRGFSEQKIISGLAEIRKKQNSKQKTRPMSNPIQKIRSEAKENSIQVEPKKIKTIQEYFEPIGGDKLRIDKMNKVISGELTTFESSKPEIEESEFENLTGLPSKLMNWPLKEIVLKYGGQMQLDTYSKILSRLMSTALQDQKIQERRLELIEKDFFISGIFSYINILSENLFDLAESQTEIILSFILSELKSLGILKKDDKINLAKSKKEIRDMRLKSYTKIIKEAKRSINKSLKNLKNKHDDTKPNQE